VTRILLVDDDPSLVASLGRRSRREQPDWQLVTASDGAEALRLEAHQPFDVLVTDVLMPGTDGLATIAAFRRAQPGAKILAMSGGGRHLGAEVLDYARRLGAHATLVKPFEFTDLARCVRALLGAASDHGEQTP